MTLQERSELACEIGRAQGIFEVPIREIEGAGTVNYVFVHGPDQGEQIVIRFNRDPLESSDYAKEFWSLTSAAKHGIPVPEPLAIGKLNDVPYIVQRFVPGPTAHDDRSAQLWFTLGTYARAINKIPINDAPDALFPRFGRDLRANWQKHVAYNLAELTASDELLKIGVYAPEERDLIAAVFKKLEQDNLEFGLTHGDVAPQNVLLPSDGPPVLIDWGSACVGIVGVSDYLRIYTDPQFSEADLISFAEGYGTPIPEIAELMQDVLLLNRIDVVRWAIDKRPDRVGELAGETRALIIQRFRA